MKNLKKLPVALLASILFFLFSGLQCDDKNDPEPESSKCGEHKEEGLPPFHPENNLDEHLAYTEGGYAYYHFLLPTQENVCSYEHVKYEFIVEVMTEYWDGIKCNAEITYGILYSFWVQGWVNTPPVGGSTYGRRSVKGDFGMFNLYNGGPGWFFVVLEIGIPDQGDTKLNHDYLKSAIYNASIDVDYYAHKGK